MSDHEEDEGHRHSLMCFLNGEPDYEEVDALAEALWRISQSHRNAVRTLAFANCLGGIIGSVPDLPTRLAIVQAALKSLQDAINVTVMTEAEEKQERSECGRTTNTTPTSH